jgi:hypothetical protein
MGLKGGGENFVKTIKHQIVLTRFVDDSVEFKYEGLNKRSDAVPLLRQCDRDIRHRLNKGKPLDEDSKIEIFERTPT